MENPFPYQKHQLLEKGFQFVHYQFIPELLKSSDNPINAALFAELMFLCYQLETPKTAIAFGKQSIHLGIDHPLFYEVFINLHLEIGDYLKALQEIKKAIDVYPDFLPMHHLQQKIQDYMNYDHEPKFEAENWFWQMNEYLINGKFKEISKGLNTTEIDEMEAHLLKLRVYGAKQEMEALSIGIAHYKANFPESEFSYIDEFYFL